MWKKRNPVAFLEKSRGFLLQLFNQKKIQNENSILHRFYLWIFGIPNK